MKLYRYLTGPDDDAFCHRVTAELNKGWQLHGQPTLTYDQEQDQLRGIYFQAVEQQNFNIFLSG